LDNFLHKCINGENKTFIKSWRLIIIPWLVSIPFKFAKLTDVNVPTSRRDGRIILTHLFFSLMQRFVWYWCAKSDARLTKVRQMHPGRDLKYKSTTSLHQNLQSQSNEYIYIVLFFFPTLFFFFFFHPLDFDRQRKGVQENDVMITISPAVLMLTRVLYTSHFDQFRSQCSSDITRLS